MEKYFNINLATSRWDWITLWQGSTREIAIIDLEVSNPGPVIAKYWLFFEDNPDVWKAEHILAMDHLIRPGHKQRHKGLIPGEIDLRFYHSSSMYTSRLDVKVFATVTDTNPEDPSMASGRQASVKPANTNATTLYTCPANKKFVATLRAVNQTASEILINAWLGNNGYTDADIIEYNTPIQGYTVLENSGILMGAGDTLYVQTLTTGVSFIVWGLEESA